MEAVHADEEAEAAPLMLPWRLGLLLVDRGLDVGVGVEWNVSGILPPPEPVRDWLQVRESRYLVEIRPGGSQIQWRLWSRC